MMNKKTVNPIQIWGKPRRRRLWDHCLDILQHSCVIAAFVLFLSYVQSVTAAEPGVQVSTCCATHR